MCPILFGGIMPYKNREDEKKRSRKYYLEHKNKMKKQSKQWREDHPEYMKQYLIEHKEEKAEYDKQRCIDHKEDRAEYNKQWYKDHREEKNRRSKQYDLVHREEKAEYNKQRYLNNCEELKKFTKQYRQSPEGKITQQRHSFKRRDLGFIPLNKYFEGSEAHHISENFIIYIPYEIHHSIYHNIWTWQGMDAMNKLAVEWL